VKITSLEIWPLRIPYQTDYTTSRGTTTHGEGVLVRMHSDAGLTGLGEASFLFPDRSGETLHTVPAILAHHLGPRLLGADPLDRDGTLALLAAAAGDAHSFPYSRAALDLALHDLAAKAQGLPVAGMLGGVRHSSFEVGRSLPLAAPEAVASTATSLQEQGYRGLTLKGSSDRQTDLRCCAAVREAVGPDLPLEIDPNQAWSVEDALTMAIALEELEFCTIEQPCAWWDLEGLARINAASKITITADEAVMCAPEVRQVGRMRAAEMVTIKLARVGGLSEGRRRLQAAKAAGLACNIGSKHPFGVGTAAILHFCASCEGLTQPIGYGAPLERLVDDILEEPIRFSDGITTLPEGPGLGVQVSDEKLERYAITRPTILTA